VKSAILSVISALLLLTGGRAVLAQNAGTPPKSVHTAASDGDVAQLKTLIANKADLDKPDQYGMPPLCYAAQSNAIEAVKLLLGGGAKASATASQGRTALMIAAQNGYGEIVDALLAGGADVKAKDASQSTALHLAVATGRTEIVAALIKGGADVNAEDRTKMTPYMIARNRQQTESADLLKQAGAKEPVTMGPGGPYGPDGAYGQTGQAAAPIPAATNVEVKIDPNAMREQLKAFPDIVAALKPVDANSGAEVKGWIQRRIDNRVTLLRTTEKQFAEELAFVKKVATQEKAAKTIPAIDELAATRKARYVAIGQALRDERRTAMEQNTDTMGTGMGRTRGVTRTARGGTTGADRGKTTGTGPRGTMNPYGGTGQKTSAMPVRAEPNKPPVDGDTVAQSQAWVNAKSESKSSLLEGVHRLDLAELDALRTTATEEEAKRTAATISAIMLARQERVDRIAKEWKADDERQQKLQERMGTQQQGGMYPGTGQRGTRGTTGQGTQPGAPQGRRYR
jgi:hypothetical protein